MCRSRHCSQSNGQRSQSRSSRFSRKDHHELESSQTQFDDSKWYSYEQESIRIQFTTKQTSTNVVFDAIDQENMPRVLADLHVSQCNDPKDSLVMNHTNVHTKCFKIDSNRQQLDSIIFILRIISTLLGK